MITKACAESTLSLADGGSPRGLPSSEIAPRCDVSVILPCLDEAETIAICVEKAMSTLASLGIAGEVIVVDNGSSDGSPVIAAKLGARVLHETCRGYGSALMCGAEHARGDVIIMADADDSYDLTDLERFILAVREGNDLVMGSRLDGLIEPGAMPWLHRWIGNPLLTGLLNLLFDSRIRDAHCGMRAFSKAAYEGMHLQTTGMEFASEMVIKAVFAGMRISQIPITLRRDGRSRPPHLRSFRDGWRHLRFMLLFSPTYLFLYPGIAVMFAGLFFLLLPSSGPVRIGPLNFDIHYMVLGSLMSVVGVQIVMLGLFAKSYSHAVRLNVKDRALRLIERYFTLERGLLLGLSALVVGFGTDLAILFRWLRSGMGALDAMRPALVASTLIIVGTQIVFSSFFLDVLKLPRRRQADLHDMP